MRTLKVVYFIVGEVTRVNGVNAMVATDDVVDFANRGLKCLLGPDNMSEEQARYIANMACDDAESALDFLVGIVGEGDAAKKFTRELLSRAQSASNGFRSNAASKPRAPRVIGGAKASVRGGGVKSGKHNFDKPSAEVLASSFATALPHKTRGSQRSSRQSFKTGLPVPQETNRVPTGNDPGPPPTVQNCLGCGKIYHSEHYAKLSRCEFCNDPIGKKSFQTRPSIC